MNVLGSIEVSGYKVLVTDESPPAWRSFFDQQQVSRRLEKLLALSCTVEGKEAGEYAWVESPGEEWQQEAAFALCLMAAEELHVEAPRVKFMRKAIGNEKALLRTEQEAYGVNIGKGEIFIHEDRHGCGFIETIGHEVHHEKGADEEAALAYGRYFVTRFSRAIPFYAKIFVYTSELHGKFDSFFTRHKEVGRGDWLINLDNDRIYERDPSQGEWVYIRKIDQ